MAGDTRNYTGKFDGEVKRKDYSPCLYALQAEIRGVCSKKLPFTKASAIVSDMHEKRSFNSRTAIRLKQTTMLTFNEIICFLFHRLHLMKVGRAAKPETDNL